MASVTKISMTAVFCLCVSFIASAPGTGTLRLRFLDARTGAAVSPSRLEIDKTPIEYTSDDTGLHSVELENGTHELQIVADPYQSMTATVVVDGAKAPMQEFELDPAASQVEEEVDKNEAVLQGNVTDAITGKLLAGVKINSFDTMLTTMTDSAGYYELRVDIPERTESQKPVMSLDVSMEGYVTEEMRNLEMLPGGRRQLPIRLERVTSETKGLLPRVTDEAKWVETGRRYDWVFDATVR